MEQLLSALVPYDEIDCHDIMFEVTAGVGGQEAMIFTQELFEMYNSYTHYKGWNCDIVDYCHTEMGKLN